MVKFFLEGKTAGATEPRQQFWDWCNSPDLISPYWEHHGGVIIVRLKIGSDSTLFGNCTQVLKRCSKLIVLTSTPHAICVHFWHKLQCVDSFWLDGHISSRPSWSRWFTCSHLSPILFTLHTSFQKFITHILNSKHITYQSEVSSEMKNVYLRDFVFLYNSVGIKYWVVAYVRSPHVEKP